MRMRPGILSCFLAAAALVVAAEPVQRSERGDQELAPVRPFDQAPQIIMVTAGNFEFTPALIHIKLGQHFQLQVASTDKTYGVRLDPFPDGATRSKPIPPLMAKIAGRSKKVNRPKSYSSPTPLELIRPLAARIAPSTSE